MIYLAIALLSGIYMAYGNEQTAANKISGAWEQFVNTIQDWKTLVEPYEPRSTGCGVVYELPNFLNRFNEDFAIVDMRNILFAEPHYHPAGVTEIYIVLQGTGLIVVGDNEYRVSQGDVVIIPPLVGHYTIPYKDFVIAVINTPPYCAEHYIPLPEWLGRVNNKITVQSYESATEPYIRKTPTTVGGDMKTWIDKTLSLLPSDARIIEIGSAFGRDAAYIEAQGFTVERTDATQEFVTLLQQQKWNAHSFNIVTDAFEASYDLVFANAVFLHLTRYEFTQALQKIHAALSDNGILAFSVKEGAGEQWETEKLGKPRYFCYWTPETLSALLESTEFEIIGVYQSEPFLCSIARKKSAVHPG